MKNLDYNLQYFLKYKRNLLSWKHDLAALSQKSSKIIRQYGVPLGSKSYECSNKLARSGILKRLLSAVCARIFTLEACPKHNKGIEFDKYGIKRKSEQITYTSSSQLK
jgi:hypothetical protein